MGLTPESGADVRAWGYDGAMDDTFPLRLTRSVLDLGDALRDAGYDAVLVGGAVRDGLLGEQVCDLDLVTDAAVEDVRRVANCTASVRSVYAVGERFGTLGVVLEDGTVVEVSTYREGVGGAGDVRARFAADARHRDFTVNAMGALLPGGELLDPLGGLVDLRARLLRAPGDPAERFAEDPLRVLRGARFVARLGFSLEPSTAEAMAAAAPRLAEVAAERVREELTKLLLGEDAPAGLEVLQASGAMEVVLPEVAALDGVTQPSFHDLDVLAHAVQAVGHAPRERVLRWATLLHDVGKAPARTVEESGRIRFFRHAQLGAEIAERICERLRFSHADTRAIVHLVAEHMRLGDVNVDNPRSIDRAVRKLDLWRGATRLVSAEDAVELTMADFSATAHRDEAEGVRAMLESAVAESRERGTHTAAKSPLSGSELIELLGLPEGPAVGAAKGAIEHALAEGELDAEDRDGALRVARNALICSPEQSDNHSCEEDPMSDADKVLEAMREAGEPLNAGKIAELSGLDRKAVDKAMAELKKTEQIESPVRCKWVPKG